MLLDADITIVGVQVSLYHYKAAANQPDAVQDVVWAAVDDIDVPIAVWTGAQWRKPSSEMLQAVKATVYYGDSDEDETAAKAAECAFVRVARFEDRK